jgi:NADH pyrophosphatase NudC (nudix superfamily)
MATGKRLIYLEDAIARIVDTPSYVATMAFEGYYGFIQNPANILVARQHEILDLLEAVPTVDAVEMVHGHWCWEGRFKACSRCGSYVEWTETLGASFWKFCPFCGAKMDGDGNA